MREKSDRAKAARVAIDAIERSLSPRRQCEKEDQKIIYMHRHTAQEMN